MVATMVNSGYIKKKKHPQNQLRFVDCLSVRLFLCVKRERKSSGSALCYVA